MRVPLAHTAKASPDELTARSMFAPPDTAPLTSCGFVHEPPCGRRAAQTTGPFALGARHATTASPAALTVIAWLSPDATPVTSVAGDHPPAIDVDAKTGSFGAIVKEFHTAVACPAPSMPTSGGPTRMALF